ncbi:MAG: hypothetical protein U1E52_15565 [Geminicoccaceae bacterium]
MAQFIRKQGIDNSKVDDMSNVDPSFMLGAILGYDFELGEHRNLALEFLSAKDVANGNGASGALPEPHSSHASRRELAHVVRPRSTWAKLDMDAYFAVSPRRFAPQRSPAESTTRTPASRTSGPTWR